MDIRPESETPDTIHDLEKKLYRREVDGLTRERRGFSSVFSRTGVSELTEEGIHSENMAPKNKSGSSFIYKLFIGSFAFFVLAVAGAAYLFLSGSATFSDENIDISISGPVAIEGGKDLSLQVQVTNKNSSELQTVDFVVEYPDGTRDPADTSKSLTSTREFLDVIKPGEVINKTVRAVLFGQENTEKTITVRLEFQLDNSNATFTRTKIYTLSLTSSPVGLTMTVPEQTVSGDTIALNVALGSNSDAPVRGVLLAMNYPPGFSVTKTEPEPAFQDSVWQIGDLAPGQKRTIYIEGTLEGQNDETKAFKAQVGTASVKAEDTLGTVYTSVFKTLSIQRPQLGAELTLNRSSEETVTANPAQLIEGQLSITNNLPDQIRNPEVSVKLIGQALNRDAVTADQGGFYESSNNEIIWDSNGNKELEALEPGGTRILKFSFASLSPAASNFPKIKNPDMMLEVTVSGTRLSPGKSGETVQTSLKRRIKLSSITQLSSRLVYSVGPFKNTGPLPPVADQKTTYTATWSISNLSSDLTGVTVEAPLPQYVEWLGVVSPADQKISLSGGKIIWNVGSVRSGAGVTSSAREVSFQVSFKPSLAQVGASPVLISETVLKGTDDFTQQPITVIQRPLTTSLTTDPAFRDGQDRVIK